MTTGRINQVTIVRRGWPPAPAGGRREIVQVTGGGRGDLAVPRAAGAVAGGPEGGNLISPSRFPQAPVRRTRVRLGGLRRRTLPGASAISASATGGCPLSARGRRSHRPLTHRAQASTTGRRAPTLSSPGHRLGGLAGCATTILPPRARRMPASLFRGVRSGRVQDKVH